MSGTLQKAKVYTCYTSSFKKWIWNIFVSYLLAGLKNTVYKILNIK